MSWKNLMVACACVSVLAGCSMHKQSSASGGGIAESDLRRIEEAANRAEASANRAESAAERAAMASEKQEALFHKSMRK
jgi:hypothetical protein